MLSRKRRFFPTGGVIHDPFLSAAIHIPLMASLPQDSGDKDEMASQPQDTGDNGEMHIPAAPHVSAFAAVDLSPPRSLSQIPAPANKVVFRGAAGVQIERDSMDEETRFKKLGGTVRKTDITNKDFDIIKAEVAQIQNCQKADAEFADGIRFTRHLYVKRTRPTKCICTMAMDIHQHSHTSASNEQAMNIGHRSDALKLKHQAFMDSGTSASGELSLEESNHVESKSRKCKEIKSKGARTDVPDVQFNTGHFGYKKTLLDTICSISCNVSDSISRHATSLLGSDLISKILVSWREEIFVLNQSRVSSSTDDVSLKVSDIVIRHLTAFLLLLQRRMDRLEDENRKLRTEIEVIRMSRDLVHLDPHA